MGQKRDPDGTVFHDLWTQEPGRSTWRRLSMYTVVAERGFFVATSCYYDPPFEALSAIAPTPFKPWPYLVHRYPGEVSFGGLYEAHGHLVALVRAGRLP